MVAIAILVLILIAGVLVGSVAIDSTGVLRAMLDRLPFINLPSGLTEVQERVLFEIRLPRVVIGGIVGSILALAGAGYQGVFRNPLADPYLLGVAAGAGLGATFVIAVGGGSALIPPLAFLGGLSAVLATYALGKTAGGRTMTSLILAGVAVAAFATAIQTFLLQRNYETLREVYSWILGRLVTVGWSEVLILLPYALAAGAVLVLYRRLLDVLALGDDEAAGLGVDVLKVRRVVVLAATLATAAAVSVSGLIGFVGIIVPHTVRLLTGWSYRLIIPLSILYGASFLVLADLVARTVVAPAELPIGVVTAFLGAPFFVVVLRTVRGSR
ncbi:MAG: iron ABC transporter permease [Actinomycetota bacterium]|nr:iron ABC transporter permease [Actinomycetota bacterium]